MTAVRHPTCRQTCSMRRRKFPLGTACFDWPPEPGADEPSESAPGAWKLAFKAQADADPELYSTIYTVCRAGRDYALTTAPKASLLILLHTSRISERLKMIQQALRTRGLQPTTLAVFTDHKAATEAAADTLAPLFSEAAVTALHISDLSDTGAPSAALQRLVQGPAHHLVRLHIGSPCPLPVDPTRLPTLQRVTIDFAGHQDWVNVPTETVASLKPYITRLKSLCLRDSHPELPVHLLFTPTTTAHTLTKLETAVVLDDALLPLLLSHAPALQELTVQTVSLEVSYQDKEWGLQKLRVRDYEYTDQDALRLPTRENGCCELAVDQFEILTAGAEGIDPDTLEWLSGWRLNAFSVYVDCVPVDGQTQLFNLVLHQLTENVEAKNAGLHFTAWTWNADSLRSCLQAFPALESKDLKPAIALDMITCPDMFSVCIEYATGPLPILYAQGIEMETDQFANVPWPWQELTLIELSAGDLLRLPDPRGNGPPRILGCHEYHLNDVTPANAEAINARLQYIHIMSQDVRDALEINLCQPEDLTDTPPTDFLTAQLSVLQATRFIPTQPQHALEINVCDYAMTHDIMDTLRGLRSLSSTLNLQNRITWPLEPSEYKYLAQCIPTSYTEWSLGKVSVPVLRAVCEGICARRAGLGLERVLVVCVGLAKGAAGQVGEHVKVVYSRGEYGVDYMDAETGEFEGSEDEQLE